jgi:hypothetical protein
MPDNSNIWKQQEKIFEDLFKDTTAKRKQVEQAVRAASASIETIQTPPAKGIDFDRDQEYLDQLPKVTRIALLAINELIQQGKAEFLFLKDDELREFWESHMKDLGRIQARQAALNKLTDDEKRLLGLSN